MANRISASSEFSWQAKSVESISTSAHFMPKKRPHAFVANPKRDSAALAWRRQLSEYDVNEISPGYTCNIILMSELTSAYTEAMEKFHYGARISKSTDTFSINSRDLMDSFNQLDSASFLEKGSNYATLFKQVADEAKHYTNDDGTIDEYIPVELTAKLIKVQIIITILKEVAGKRRESLRKPSSKQIGKTKKVKRVEAKIESVTVLEERQLLFFVSGFHHPNIAEELWKAGLKLTAILEIAKPSTIFKEKKETYLISSSSSSTSDPSDFIPFSESEGFIIFMNYEEPTKSNDTLCPSSLMVEVDYENPTGKSTSVETLTTDILSNFWSKIYKQLEGELLADFLEDTVHLRISPNYEIASKKESTEYYQQALDFFLYVCKEVTKIDSARLQHKAFLNNLEVCDVIFEPIDTAVASFKKYYKLMNSVPPECVTVGLLLHCLLEEICTRVPDDATNNSLSGGLPDSGTENKMEESQDSLLDKQLKRDIANYIIQHRIAHSPLYISGILRHRSNFKMELKLANKCFLVHPTNFLEIIVNCYKSLSAEFLKINGRSLKKCLAVLFWQQHRRRLNPLQILLKCILLQHLGFILDISPDAVIRTLNVILFKTLNYLSPEVKKSATNNAYSIFCGKTESEESKVYQLSETCAASSGTSESKLSEDVYINLPPTEYSKNPNIYQAENVSTYMWYENLKPMVILQKIEKASRDYICTDHHYCAFTDTIILRFHNDVDAYGINNKKWKGFLRTPVGFRDFCKYILKDVCHEAQLSDEQGKKNASQQIPETHQEPETTGQQKPENHQEPGTDKGPEEMKTPSLSTQDSESQRLLGYNLGKALPQLTGSTTVFHSQDGYKVTVDQTTFIGQPKQISLNVNIRDNNFILHFNKNQTDLNEPLTFHFSLEDGSVIVFSKPPRFTKPKINVTEVTNRITSKKRKKISQNLLYKPREKRFFYSEKTKCCKPTLDIAPSKPQSCVKMISHISMSDWSLCNDPQGNPISSEEIERYFSNLENPPFAVETKPYKSNASSIGSHSSIFDRLESKYEKMTNPSDINRIAIPMSYLDIPSDSFKDMHSNKMESPMHDFAKSSSSSIVLESKCSSCSVDSSCGSHDSSAGDSCICCALKRTKRDNCSGSNIVDVFNNPEFVRKLSPFELLHLFELTAALLKQAAFGSELLDFPSDDSLKRRVDNVSSQLLKHPSNGSIFVEEEIRNIDFTQLVPSTESMKKKYIQYVVQKIRNAKKDTVPLFKIISSKLHKFEYVKRKGSYVRIRMGKHFILLKCKSPYCRMVKKEKIIKMFPTRMTDDIHFNSNQYDLKLSLPSGLILNTVSGINYRPFYIKQRFIQKGPQCKAIINETSRTFIRDGRVVVKKCDGTINVLCPDGQIINCEILHLAKRTSTKYVINKRNKTQENSGTSSNRHRIERLECHLKRHVVKGTYQRCYRRQKMQRRYLKRLCAKNPLTYTVITHDGRTFKTTGKHTETKERVFQDLYNIKDRSEYMYVKDDGTVCLLNEYGRLITEFYDKTRITTWFTIEPEEINISADLTSSGESSSNTVLSRQLTNLSVFVPIYCKDVKVLPEGWIDVTMHYKFEHPNYITVIYNSLDYKTDIVLPNKVHITVSDEGFYDVDIEDIVIAKINHDEIYLKSALCQSCREPSITTINIKPLYDDIYPLPENIRLLQTHDTYEKVFFVTYNGTCSRNSSFVNSRTNRSNCKEHDKEEHQQLYFLNRDLSGVKYWDVKSCHKHLVKAAKDCHSVIQYNDRPLRSDNNYSSISVRSHKQDSYYSRFLTSYRSTLLSLPQFRHTEFKSSSAYITIFEVFALPVEMNDEALHKIVINLTETQMGFLKVNSPEFWDYVDGMVKGCTGLRRSSTDYGIIREKFGSTQFSQKLYNKEKEKMYMHIELLSSQKSVSAQCNLATASLIMQELNIARRDKYCKGTQCDFEYFHSKKGVWQRIGLERPKNIYCQCNVCDGSIDFERLEAKAHLLTKLKKLSQDVVAQHKAVDCYLLNYCQRRKPDDRCKHNKSGVCCQPKIITKLRNDDIPKDTSQQNVPKKDPKKLHKSTETDKIPIRHF